MKEKPDFSREELKSLLNGENQKPEDIYRFCQMIGKTEPAFQRLLDRDLRLPAQFPDSLDILFHMAKTSLEAGNSPFKVEASNEFFHQNCDSFQWENACSRGIKIRLISPAFLQVLLGSTPPGEITLWEEVTTPVDQTVFYLLPTITTEGQSGLQIQGEEVRMIGVTIMSSDEVDLQDDKVREKYGIYKEKIPDYSGEDKQYNLAAVTAHTKSAIYSVIHRFEGNNPFTPEEAEHEEMFNDNIPKIDDLSTCTRLLALGLLLIPGETNHAKLHSLEKITVEYKAEPTGGAGASSFVPKILGGNLHL